MMAYGIMIGMKLKMDKSGRIVFPKPLRERLGLKADMELEALEQPGGRVLLRPLEQRPSMVRVWVHQGVALPDAAWERVIEDVREAPLCCRFGAGGQQIWSRRRDKSSMEARMSL
jgi:AbrB family looped-hinge helix DNA binding protein